METKEAASSEQQAASNEKTYPTQADAAGFYYESEDDEKFGIETKNEQGDITKHFKFMDGRNVVVRELIGSEIMLANKMVPKGNKDNTKVIDAMMSLATSADGKIIPFETIGNLKSKDYTKLMAAYSSINF